MIPRGQICFWLRKNELKITEEKLEKPCSFLPEVYLSTHMNSHSLLLSLELSDFLVIIAICFDHHLKEQAKHFSYPDNS